MNVKSEWWQDFFAGPWGKYQALGYSEDQTRKEVDFLVSALKLANGDRVLDVGCGIGRHSIGLAGYGCDVTGIDFSEQALANAMQAASNVESGEGGKPHFEKRDMRRLHERDSYDAAFCFFSSFGYFSDAENADVASRIARALKPGGRLLIDTVVTESLFPVFRERQWSWAGPDRSLRVLEESAWVASTGRVVTTWTFIHEDGRCETSRSSIRVYSYRELNELLKAAGFRELRGVATGTDEPFELGSPRLSLMGRK